MHLVGFIIRMCHDARSPERQIQIFLHSACFENLMFITRKTTLYMYMYNIVHVHIVQRNCPKHVEFYSKNKFEKFVNLVGFIIRRNELKH